MVMNNPFSRDKDPINHDVFERFFGHIDIVKSRKQWVELVTNEIKTKIDEHIKKLNPDLLQNFEIIYQELTQMMKEFQKTINDIEKKSKKIFDSSSMAQDVFRMRDEMKILKKKIDRLNGGLRNLSKLSTFLEEEKDE